MEKTLARCAQRMGSFFIPLLFTLLLVSQGIRAQEQDLRSATAADLSSILALPYVAPQEASPVEGFAVYGGEWRVDADGVLAAPGNEGARLIYDDPQWRQATEGVVELELRFPNAASGFSGVCFKITDAQVGADAFNGYEIGFNPAEKLVNLGAHRHNYHQLKRYAYDVPVGRFFKLSIHFDATGFEFYIDGEKTGEYRDPNPQPDDPLRVGTFAPRLWQNAVEYRSLRVKLGDAPFQDVPFLPAQPSDAETPETMSVDDVPPILYVARSVRTRPYSVGNELWQSLPKQLGAAIRLVDPNAPEDGVKTIFADPDGAIFDMNLSYDAKTIYFSYRPKDSEYWNIWKINVDGSGLTQLTKGPFFDVSPAELPDGGIVFVSNRRFGRTVCQPGPASNLFTMNADGSNIRCVSMNTLSDFTPQVLPDGRVLFTRWEYIDRDLTYRQSLWTQNPEGTQYQLFYGNTQRDFGSVLQARPIPGAPASKVIAAFTPHHGYPCGAVGIVDRSKGIEAGKEEGGYQFWSVEFNDVQDHQFEYAYRDPFALDEERALCAFGSTGPSVLGKDAPRYRIWLLDCDGNRRLLCEEPRLDCFCPIPLVETPRPSLPASRVVDSNLQKKLRPTLQPRELYAGLRKTDSLEAHDDYYALVDAARNNDELVDAFGIPERQNFLDGDPVGQVVLADVYQGLEPTVKRGTIKTIRIMEQIRKTEELYNRAFDQSPSMGAATYYAKRCWGDVPVEEDGSANFFVPALREIYFQALDADGREVQRMTSAVQFMPGESIGCVGCHEDRDSIPATAQDASRRPIAGLRAPDLPQLPEFIYAAHNDRARRGLNPTLDAGVLDYQSLVQPVLDKYCLSCHDSPNPAGGCDLSGDMTRFFCMSYESLLLRSRSYRQEDMLTGEMLDSQKELGKPLVQFYWLLWTSSGIHQPYSSGAYASRLPEYFDESHCKAKVDQQSMERILLWLDSNAIYQGTYAHARPDSPGRRDRWGALDGEGFAPWFKDEFLPIYEEKCQSCHQRVEGGNDDLHVASVNPNTDWTGRFAWINLTRPEMSAALLVHLPKAAGGRGVPTNQDDKNPTYIFNNKEDKDWTRMLRAIERGRDDALARPDADQPGFRNARPEP